VSAMEIPYTTEVRPDTGLTNPRLGMWLFLASEVMLFGSLFSAYVLLRTGVEVWPDQSAILDVPLATLNTVILIASSVTMVLAWAGLRVGNLARGRRYLGLTFLGGTLFLIVKAFEYGAKFSDGLGPATSNFLGVYFTMTGLHALHVIGGMVVIGYLWGPGASLWRRNADQYTHRVEVTGIYWHFVDLVWIFLFPVLYLL
jgi:cytochrome c oxidase subunit III